MGAVEFRAQGARIAAEFRQAQETARNARHPELRKLSFCNAEIRARVSESVLTWAVLL